MTRRAKGEGTLFQRESDGRWVGYITIRGKRSYATAKTKKEAAAKLAKLKVEGKKPKGVPLVRDFLLQLMEGELKEEHKYGHWATNEVYARTRVAPSDLGYLRLDEVTTGDIQRFIDDQKLLPKNGKPSAGKLSPTTVRRIGALVSLIFSKAKSPRYGYIRFNPCDGVEYPQIRETVKRTLSPEEAYKLPDSAASPRLRAMVTVARDTGLRRGEICGLKWADVKKLADGSAYLVINQTVVRKDGGIGEDSPKTRTSFKREVDLTPDALAAIEAQPRRSDFIFSTESGRAIRPDNFSRDFRILRTEAGMGDLKLHGLRSSYISIMLEAGADVRTVQELVGHSSSRITQEIYARSRRELKRSATASFARRVSA